LRNEPTQLSVWARFNAALALYHKAGGSTLLDDRVLARFKSLQAHMRECPQLPLAVLNWSSNHCYSALVQAGASEGSAAERVAVGLAESAVDQGVFKVNW